MTDWITVEDLADFMEVDELLLVPAENAVASACDAVRKYLDQTITFVADDEFRRDGKGADAGRASRQLRLPERPVRAVTSLTIDGVAQVADTDYVVRPLRAEDDGIGCQIKLLTGFLPQGVDNIVVVYDHGWGLDGSMVDLPIPSLLLYWTKVIARRHYLRQGKKDTAGKQAETIGAYAYTNDVSVSEAKYDLTPAEMAGLENFAIRLKV